VIDVENLTVTNTLIASTAQIYGTAPMVGIGIYPIVTLENSYRI
jgi:hypothetical protein